MRSGLAKLPQLIVALQEVEQEVQALGMTTMQLTERLGLTGLTIPTAMPNASRRPLLAP